MLGVGPAVGRRVLPLSEEQGFLRITEHFTVAGVGKLGSEVKQPQW